MKKSYFLICFTIMLLSGFHSLSQSITISAAPGDTVCAGALVTFTADTTGPGPYGYKWTVDGVHVGASAHTYSTSALTNGSVVICVLTNVAGDTVRATSNTLIITVDSLPAIGPITGGDSVCVGSTLTLSDTAAGGVWRSDNPAAAIISPTGVVTGVSVPMGGGFGPPTVRIVYTMTNGCGTDSVRFRIMVATPASPIGLSLSTICVDSPALAIDSARGGFWISSDSTIAGFLPIPPILGIGIIRGHAAGTVTITYAGANACGLFMETATLTVVNCDSSVIDTGVGVHNVVSPTNNFTVYPNPSAGTITIIAPSSQYSQALCTITNMVGEKVEELTVNTNHPATINLSVPAGIYFITLAAGNQKHTSRLVITQ